MMCGWLENDSQTIVRKWSIVFLCRVHGRYDIQRKVSVAQGLKCLVVWYNMRSETVGKCPRRAPYTLFIHFDFDLLQQYLSFTLMF